jgi:hypothetical protein
LTSLREDKKSPAQVRSFRFAGRGDSIDVLRRGCREW